MGRLALLVNLRSLAPTVAFDETGRREPGLPNGRARGVLGRGGRAGRLRSRDIV
jgi:hypothetical protein